MRIMFRKVLLYILAAVPIAAISFSAKAAICATSLEASASRGDSVGSAPSFVKK